MTRGCALGLDFGTASVRALVVDTATGRERGSAVVDYRHGVIDAALPGTGAKLPADWALQHPGDYMDAAAGAVHGAMAAAGLGAADIVGVGVDFTSCTILPVDARGRALALQPEWAARPHAWVKLWKHHAAQPQADRINALAAARGEAFLSDYGGKTSSEWLFAKALQVLEEDPDVFAAAASFVEAGDWFVQELSGVLVRNSCGAGYKGFWSRERGFPSREFLAALDPRFVELAGKLGGEITPPGRRVGGLTEAAAARLGLAPGTAVAAAIIDAHSAVPAATVVEPRRMVMVMGTSTCHMLLADRHAVVEGVGGVVRDGIVEGWFGYEAGQPAVGDIFGWFAKLVGAGDFASLERGAAECPPGGRGLLALDWWNGNRSVLVDANLSGLIVGLTLSTTAAGDLPRADRGDGLLDAADPGCVRGEADPGRGADRGGRARRAQSPPAPDLCRRHPPPDRARRHRERLGARRGDARRRRGGRGTRRPRDLRRCGARHGSPARREDRAECRRGRGV